MYICLNCGEIFDKGKILHDDSGDYQVCPVCRDDDYSDAIKCELCGEYYSSLSIATEHFCARCIDEVRDTAREFMLRHLGGFERWALLEGMVEGEIKPEEIIPQGRPE